MIILIILKVVESAFDVEFIKHIIPSLHWESLTVGAECVGFKGLPAVMSDELLEDDQFLQAVHHVLLDIHVLEGTLVCPETGKRFPITHGVPSMMYVYIILNIIIIL
jgi:multifunctional methyltransferase subunit TRM112